MKNVLTERKNRLYLVSFKETINTHKNAILYAPQGLRESGNAGQSTSLGVEHAKARNDQHGVAEKQGKRKGSQAGLNLPVIFKAQEIAPFLLTGHLKRLD